MIIVNIAEDDLNKQLRIEALGEPGPGGAHFEYSITLPNGDVTILKFQNGNPADCVNGISIEALVSIAIHRLEGFQTSPIVSCRENSLARTSFQEGLLWLWKRWHDRSQRGVVGQVVK